MKDAAIEAIGQADVVIGLVPPSTDPQKIGAAIATLVQARVPFRKVLVHPPLSAAGPSFENTGWQFICDERLAQDRSALSQSFGKSFRAIFDVAAKLNARACAIVTSDPSTVTPDWVELLVNPVMNDGFDLVAPCYTRNPFDGLVNRAIVYPMVRALYGRRVRNPMGPDFGLSNTLFARMSAGARPRLHPLVSLVAEAIATEMKICQSNLGTRLYPSLDWANPSPYLSQVLAALFLDVERFAPYWQRARGSQPVVEFGTAASARPFGAAIDLSALMQGFLAGESTLIEVWGGTLPPSTLLELRKIARQTDTRFRIPDETWARIVYDFALAHRLQPANREQMLRAFTPIYMGWVVSYALEIANASSDAVERRIEELCGAFETTKPYFVSRWRWPDRFNP